MLQRSICLPTSVPWHFRIHNILHVGCTSHIGATVPFWKEWEYVCVYIFIILYTKTNTRESISLHLWMDHLYPGYIEILPKIVHGLLLWFRTLSNNANINSITHLKDHAARLQYALRSIRRCKFHCDECYESFGCENSSEMLCFSKCWLITGSQQKAVQTIHQKSWMTEERL